MTYAYQVPSVVRRVGERSELLLETSGGRTKVGPAAHPYFFQGFLTDPGPAALGMLACAAVARARYYTPASVIAAIQADPVVTSNGDRLRFESFSGCCGVHARLDLLPSALAGPPVTAGTTNVDFNEPMRACLVGSHRLAELGPLLRFARGLKVYSAEADTRSLPMPSAWELDLGTARFTLTLSPEKHRGFSGEGALLGLLADPDAAADADLISVLLAWDPRIDIGRLSAGAQISAERTGLALSYLAATGRVGYDLAEESFFHRELPFGPALEAMHPRLAGARALISSGSVVAGQRGALVRSGDTEHRVTFASPYDLCTCPWWGKHRGTRGPCKHVLAARMAVES